MQLQYSCFILHRTKMHHGSTRRADGTDHRAHSVAMCECHSMFDERVEIRRLEQRGAQRMRAVRAMVVGMDMENVWLAGMKCRQRP